MAKPFEYIKSFSNKNSVWEDSKDYVPFVINKGLSYIYDCVHYSNEMNKRPFLDRKQQHDFYMNVISKGNRYGEWLKKVDESPDIQIISEYYCINKRMAAKYIEMLSDEQIQLIRDKMNTGGK